VGLNSIKFCFPKNIFIKKDANKVLFLNPNIPSWFVTNNNGAFLLTYLNGTVPDDKTIKYLSEKTGVKGEEIIDFVLTAKKHLFPVLKNDESSNKQPKFKLSVYLSMTDNCNLNCIYCYASKRSTELESLKKSEYIRLVDDLNNISGPLNFTFTGGEPLLNNDIFYVANYAKIKANNISLLTNGILICESNVNKISELFGLIKISIDGSNKLTHEYHRGESSYDKTINAIDLLDKHNANYMISMTVTKKNIDDIESMSRKYGSRLTFAPLFVAGKAKNKKELSINGEDYYNALNSVDEINPMGYLAESLVSAKCGKTIKCSIGDREISFSPNGNVYPCHLLHYDEFNCGNIREESMFNIYKKSLKLVADCNVENIQGCSNCGIKYICAGACRARAYFEKGNIMQAGNFCDYEKMAIINGIIQLHSFDN